MVLENVERGEISWRAKGPPHICHIERTRIEREMRGEQVTEADEELALAIHRKTAARELKRAAAAVGRRRPRRRQKSRRLPRPMPARPLPAARRSRSGRACCPAPARGRPRRTPSTTRSARATSRSATPHPSEPDATPSAPTGDDEAFEMPGPLRSNHASSSALDGTMYGAYTDDPMLRGRSPSMADSVLSHISSMDFDTAHDPYAEDFSYVPCFTFGPGTQFLQGHRAGPRISALPRHRPSGLKPANLLWSKDFKVKISDLASRTSDGPPGKARPTTPCPNQRPRTLMTTESSPRRSGPPAFFAPELCYTDVVDTEPPKVSEQIDVWSLASRSTA